MIIAFSIYLLGSFISCVLLYNIHRKNPFESDWSAMFIGAIASWVIVGLAFAILVYDWHNKLVEKYS